MRRFLAISPLALAVALASLPSPKAQAQTVINVGACVPTPGGVVSTKFCADGDDGSSALVWAAIPGFEWTEGTPYSIDLADTYLTQPEPRTATCSSVGASLPTGWTWTGSDSCTLSYSGTGTGSVTGVIVRASRLAVTQDTTPSFSVAAIASVLADVTAPTVAGGVEVTLNDSDDPVITFDAAADVRVSGQDVSDVSTFTVYRGATALTPTAYTGASFVPTFADTDVGTVVGSSATQSGANWTLVGEGGDPATGTNHVFVNAEVTGDFTATVKITSISGGSNGSRGAGLSVRAGTDAGARQFALQRFPSENVRSYTRSDTDGAVTQAGVVASMGLPYWLRITKVGDEFTGYASEDGNAFSEVHSAVISMGSTLNVGPTATSNQAGTPITVAADNLTVTTRARQTYTDTAGVPGSSSYTVRSTDGAANVASASAAVVAPAVPVGSISDTPDYDDPLEGVTLLGGRTVTACATEETCLTQLADQDCNETIAIANGVTITGNRSITADCNTNDPFIVGCANELQCTFTGLWTFTEASANNILKDVLFSGTGAKVMCDGDTNHVIGNEFTGWSGIAVSPRNNDGRGRRCEIAYNEFHHHAAYGPKTYSPSGCTPGVDNPCTLVVQFRMGIRTNDDGVGDFHTGGWWHHNYFHDFLAKEEPTVYGSSQNDAMEAAETEGGTYPQINSQLWIEHSLIENHFQGGSDAGVCGGSAAGAAVVDLKSGGVVVRYLTLDHACGNVDARGGSQYGRTMESIYFDTDSPAGIGVRGTNVRVIGNRVTGPMNITAGQLACTAATGASDANGPNSYPASCNALLVGNIVTGTTTIGHRYDNNNASWTFPASNVTVRAHTGSISQRGNDCPPPSGACVTGANINASAAAGVNYVPAFRILPSDVGPDALDDADADYLAARDY